MLLGEKFGCYVGQCCLHRIGVLVPEDEGTSLSKRREVLSQFRSITAQKGWCSV
jgi:hypothetical protein